MKFHALRASLLIARKKALPQCLLCGKALSSLHLCLSDHALEAKNSLIWLTRVSQLMPCTMQASSRDSP